MSGPDTAFDGQLGPLAQRYPDPQVEVLDEAFRSLRLFSASVERLASGCRWSEGPVWMGDWRSLLWSDIPNDRILRWDEADGRTSVYRQGSNHANGLARDGQGRLVTCEHRTRRITRTEFDGAVTVLADRFQGRRLNSPNDIVCDPHGHLWFTDPDFGLHGHWEGEPGTPELPHAVYRLDAQTGELRRVIDDLAGPNGLAFAPDGQTLYVIESRAQPHRRIWGWRVDTGGGLHDRRLVVDAGGPGALDGMAVDVRGFLWCGLGSNGAPGAAAEGLDGVRVYDPQDGRAIGHIHLPERCANVCFGGRHRNRLFMAASHSLYGLFVNTQGA